MKSLKRTLCLVLALVMVLGLFGIASASSFTDDNAIQYKEAVDVMTGIGAINGYNDGSFGPKGTITRAEAAKLVAYTVLGKATADKLTGVSSSFTDVDAAAYGWAIPSIEYLVKEGVINGRGDGTFDPAGNIDGYAVLKMLLCALGYGKKGEYVGSQWDLNVAIDAGKNKLTAGSTNTGVLSAPATREEVALYCFNTIQKDMVEYVSTLDVYLNKDGGLTGDGTTETIWSNIYPGLEVNSGTTPDYSGTDDFGAPANVWTYNNKPIGAYADKELVAYTGEQTLAKVSADLKGYTINATKLENNNSNGTATTAASIKDLTGNGTVVKVYATDTTVDKVVQIKTDVAKVALVDSAKKTVTIHTETTGATTADDYIIDSDHAVYGTVSGLAEGDYVLVTLAKDNTVYKVISASVPSQVTGRVTTVNVAQKAVTLNGTTPYGIAATTTSAITAPDDADSSTILWLDSYGYVVASKTTAAVTAKFAYVLDTYTTLTNNRLVNMAKVVYTNGTTGDIAMDNDIGSGANEVHANMFVKLGSPDAAGKYNLTAPVSSDKAAAAKANEVKAGIAAGDALVIELGASADGEIKATDKGLTQDAQKAGSAATNYFVNYYSNNVKFIYIDTTTKTATVLDGVQAVKTIPNNSLVILERHNATDDTGVVTAVILPGAKPSGVVDTSKLVYLAPTATITASTGSLDPAPDTSTGHVPVAAPVATTTLKDSSTGKDVKVPVFNAYINGVQQPIPSTSAVSGKTYNTVGFYTLAPVPNVTGQYELNAYVDTDEDVKKIELAATTSAFESLLTVSYGNPASPTTKVLDIAKATVVDVRAADAQTAQPITPTPNGLIAAMRSYDLNISVLYNSKADTASMIYINGATPAPTTYTITNSSSSGVPVASGLTYSVQVDKTSAAKDATVTITIKATTSDVKTGKDTLTLTVKDAGNNAIALTEGTAATGYTYKTNSIEVDLTATLAAGGKTVSFTMPASNVTISVDGSHGA